MIAVSTHSTLSWPLVPYLAEARLQVETLDLCTDMRAIVRAHIVVGLLGSHLQASLYRLTPPSEPMGLPHESLNYYAAYSIAYSTALVRYRGLFKRTPCGLERLARLPLKGERWYNSTQPTRAEHLTWGRRRWRVTSRLLPLRPSALCFVRVALLCFPPMPH